MSLSFCPFLDTYSICEFILCAFEISINDVAAARCFNPIKSIRNSPTTCPPECVSVHVVSISPHTERELPNSRFRGNTAVGYRSPAATATAAAAAVWPDVRRQYGDRVTSLCSLRHLRTCSHTLPLLSKRTEGLLLSSDRNMINKRWRCSGGGGRWRWWGESVRPTGKSLPHWFVRMPPAGSMKWIVILQKFGARLSGWHFQNSVSQKNSNKWKEKLQTWSHA